MPTRKIQLHGAALRTGPVPVSMRLMRFLFARTGGLFPGLLARWAYWLWFRSRRFPESAAGRKAVCRAQQERLSLGGGDVVLYRWGTGPVVLFVHGWSGRGSQVAAFIEPLNVAGFQVVAVDLPGHGASSGRSTNILECAAALQAVQFHCGSLAGVITHSFGGMVLAYALNHGLHTRCAVCFCPPVDSEFLVEGFAATLHMHERVVGIFCRMLERRFDGDFWGRVSTLENVRRLAIPGLLLHDVNDRSVPWQQGEQIATAWPGARFVRTEGLGHGRILRSEQTVQAAVSFIAEHAGSG